jgi:outer membrane protein TolC
MNVMKMMAIVLVMIHMGYAATNYPVKAFIDDLLHVDRQDDNLNLQITMAERVYDQAAAINDWSIAANVANNYVQPYQNSFFSPKFQEVLSADLSLRRPFITTGGTLSFTTGHQSIRQSALKDPETGTLYNQPLFYQHTVGIQYVQPLLYGFLGEHYRYSLRTASQNVAQKTVASQEQFEDFLATELTGFVDWTLAYELSEMAYSRYQLAKESVSLTKDRARVNVSEQIDVLRAEYAMQNALQQWKNQLALLKSEQIKMATRLNKPSLRHVVPTFDLYKTVYVKSPDYIPVSTLRRYEILALDKDRLDGQLALSRSKRNGELNVVAAYTRKMGKPTRSAWTFPNYDTTVGVSYSRPLADTAAIAAVKKAEMDVTQFENQSYQLTQELKSHMVALHTLVMEYEALLETTLDQVTLSQKKATEENGLYRQGRSPIEMLIQAQDNVLASKINYAQSSAQYHKYVLMYLSLIDQLTTTYEVSL